MYYSLQRLLFVLVFAATRRTEDRRSYESFGVVADYELFENPNLNKRIFFSVF